MITCAGETLPVWEERLIREQLEGGDQVPDPFECDGCSGGWPDSFPPWRPMGERILTRDACVSHDASKRYEGGVFLSFWHRAAARWEADRAIGRNWRRLPTLDPYVTRVAEWSRWERWAYRAFVRIGFRGLRLFGWAAA